MGLPHRFPFRFTPTPGSGSPATVGLTVTDALVRGAAYPNVLLLEILAQAALGTDSGAPTDSPAEVAYLGGIDEARFSALLADHPLRPGDRLEARTEVAASFGRTSKVMGELWRGEDLLVKANLVLVTPGPPRS